MKKMLHISDTKYSSLLDSTVDHISGSIRIPCGAREKSLGACQQNSTRKRRSLLEVLARNNLDHAHFDLSYC